jgi:hypothetical protein
MHKAFAEIKMDKELDKSAQVFDSMKTQFEVDENLHWILNKSLSFVIDNNLKLLFKHKC